MTNAVVESLTYRMPRGGSTYLLLVEDSVPNVVGVRLIRLGIGTTREADCLVPALDELKSTDEGVASLRGLPTRDPTK